MKEGTFLQREGWSFEEDTDIQNVPLPSELPKPFDANTLPAHVKRSSAIEALIAQNDDLMSRLSVSLRRISELEALSEARASENEQYKARYENLRDQVLVLKEKTRILSERRTSEDSDVQALKDKAQLLEIRYAELYQSSQARESRLQTELSAAQSQNRRLSKFKNKISSVAHRMRDLLTQTEKRNTQLSDRLAQHEITIENLRTSTTETNNYIQEQSRRHQDELQNMARAYEEKLKALKVANLDLTVRTQQFDQLLEKNAQFENSMVIAERRFEDYRLQTQTEIADLQKSLARYRAENKELTLELQSAKANYEQAHATEQELRRESTALEEQVETLQALWKDNQNQIEKLNEKNKALQKLNQELSQTINQYRKEIRDLKEQIDQSHVSNAGASASESPAPASPEFIDKIDQVLGRMQVGG